jgi:hypothetical protein
MYPHPELEPRFAKVFDLVQTHLENTYGIPVIITDVANPFTGDLDGAEIRVDYDLSAEESLFILIHLFGHTVQWNLSAAAREIGMDGVLGERPGEDKLAQLSLSAYEHEACAYSLQLLHRLGVDDLDQWLADFSACDLRYLMHFYRTGEKRPFFEFWQDDAPRVAPQPIPYFHPEKWVWRADGIVV